ncbi:hypothetical protein [Pedobacter arcticus]|uniref:hypothetical protein n=1 Tax=Pedobacter arcticus TaxID=752140 RepID=UPI0002FB06B8|nr:hypothetical protein [Pedobacter arcticus]
MFKKVDFLTFNNTGLNNLSLSLTFVEITAKLINCKAVFFLYFLDDKPVLKLSSFERDGKLILPNIYPFYSGFWLDNSLSYLKQNEVLDNTLLELKKTYKSIKLMLPVEVKDIRCFIWNDFDVTVRYTYLKKLDALKFKKDMVRNHKIALDRLNFTLKEMHGFDLYWDFHKCLLSDIGFSIKIIGNLRSWIIELMEKRIIKFFCVFDEGDNYMGSTFLVLDQFKKTGNSLLEHTVDNNLKSKSNAFLKISMHYWLKENKYEYFDYLGANTRKVAENKVRSEPELQNYYIVDYKYNQFTIIRNRLHKIKRFIRNYFK